MTSVTSRFLDLIRRNLKSDAVPRPPRPSTEENEVPEENPPSNDSTADNASQEPDEILIEDNDSNTEDGPKVKSSFFKNKKKSDFMGSKPKSENIDPNKPVTVNTQATGHVVTIVNSKGTHWGNNYVYHLGSKKATVDADSDDEVIQKDNLIVLVLEAKEEIEHDYLDFIAKNLGRKWKSFFRSLGYTKGSIETFEHDEIKNGLAEVRYKILLDYQRNTDDPSLGYLANKLWEEGEREVVKGLSIIYKRNKKKL